MKLALGDPVVDLPFAEGVVTALIREEVVDLAYVMSLSGTQLASNLSLTT